MISAGLLTRLIGLGNTSTEAIRCVKRRLSGIVYKAIHFPDPPHTTLNPPFDVLLQLSEVVVN